MNIGILALQGAVQPHVRSLERLGATTVEVRRPEDLDGLDGLVLPGGESTTISMLLERQQLFAPLTRRLLGGLPALGTCAGMILMSSEILDGRADQRCCAAIDLSVRRNGFGRQIDSFEADLDIVGFAEVGLDPGPFHAVFIRAPVVERIGPDVEVLARVGDAPVLCRQGTIIVSSFHPELGDDLRVHQLLMSTIECSQRPSVTTEVEPGSDDSTSEVS